MSVTPADVAVTLGRPAPDSASSEEAQWTRWIEYALRAIERRAERLGKALADLNATDVKLVVSEAVAEKVKNPDGVRRTDLSIDDGRISKDYSKATGQVTILPEWWELLFPSEGQSAWSTRPRFQRDCGPVTL